MTYCDECDKKINGMPFHCRRCAHEYCSKHRLPENHDCSGLKTTKEKAKDWRKAVKYGIKIEKQGHNQLYYQQPKTMPKIPLWVIGIIVLLFISIYFYQNNPIDNIANSEEITEIKQILQEEPNIYTGEESKTFSYVLKGERNTLDFTTYKGLNDYLSGLSRTYTCYGSCPSDTELELRFLENEYQEPELNKLVDIIKVQADNKDDQARVAISFVQTIWYEDEEFRDGELRNKYPYEVVYSKAGVCGEKSRLLAYLLKELGYGVVLFEYTIENHMSVGIKCPMQYSYLDTGYCFVESTTPSIITYDQGDYLDVGKLISTPKIIEVSEGISFDSVQEEHMDASKFAALNRVAEQNAGLLSERRYNDWIKLSDKYGIDT
jgi:hypothetical protein